MSNAVKVLISFLFVFAMSFIVVDNSVSQDLGGAFSSITQEAAYPPNQLRLGQVFDLYASPCAAQEDGAFSSLVLGKRFRLPPQPGEFLESPIWNSENRSPISKNKDVESGKIHFDRGDFSQAAQVWLQANKILEKRDRPTKQQVQTLLNFSQALANLGHSQRAINTLNYAHTLAEQINDRTLAVAAIWQLGKIHFMVGLRQEAQEYLKKGLAEAKQLQDLALVASMLNDLGNVLVSQKQYNRALGAFTESSIIAEAIEYHPLRVRTIINLGWSLLLEGEYTKSKDYLDLAFTQIQMLEDSYYKVQGILNIGLAFEQLSSMLRASNVQLIRDSGKAFHLAAELAIHLRDRRLEAYGWGYLGHLYEEEKRFDEAITLTRLAISKAHQSNSPESLYQWHWQTARILRAKGKLGEASQAYRRAIAALQPIRNEVSTAYQAKKANFRDGVGQMYFELADVLLTRAKENSSAETRPEYLIEARNTIEGFKAAELQDYFQEDCVRPSMTLSQTLRSYSPNTAVIYPIVLKDRLELLVSFPSKIRHYTTMVGELEINNEIRALRQTLKLQTHYNKYMPHAQKIYKWLIGPFESDLRDENIDTLVFVPDGLLRTIPFAPLHDGEDYLIESYAVAITPGLSLTDPFPINRSESKILFAGITEPVRDFSSLSWVNKEVRNIKNLFSGTFLMNEAFSFKNIREKSLEEEFNILHIASHGRFEGNIKNSYIVAYDENLTMDKLSELIGLYKFRKKPLDLLTLSACETAAGDEQSGLGLAGVAISTGARSVLASLWFINDQATAELISEFYQELFSSPFTSKADALRRAQIKMINHPNPFFHHPFYWAQFVLLNNWL